MKRIIVLKFLVSLALAEIASDFVTLTLGGPIELWVKYLIAITFTVISAIDNRGRLK